MSRFTLFDQHFLDDGRPNGGGKFYFYESGSETAKDTYSDAGLSTVNANPVILTAAGRVPDVFFTGTAKLKITDSADNQIRIFDPVGGETSATAFGDWNQDQTYNIPDIVTGSDELFYISITDNNTGNDPTSDATNWTQIQFIRVWNTNETYGSGDIVKGSDGFLYSSQTASNQGNDPISDSTNWSPAVADTTSDVVKAAGKTYAYNNF